MIRIACPQCASPLSAPDDKAGLRGTCPTCGTKVLLPARRKHSDDGQVPTTHEAPLRGDLLDGDREPGGRHHAFWTLRRMLAGLVAIGLLIVVIAYSFREPHDGGNPNPGLPSQPKLYPGFSYTDFDKTREWAKGVNHGILQQQLQFSGNGIRQREIWDAYREQWRQHIGKQVTWAMPAGTVSETEVAVQNWFPLTREEAKAAHVGFGECYLQVLLLPLDQTEVTPYAGEPTSGYHYRYKSLKIGPQVNAHIARNLSTNGTVLLDAVIQDMEFFGQRTVFIILKDAKTPR